MARTIWKNRSWLCKFAWHRRNGSVDCISPDHGLYPEAYFREKLMQERKRAERSNKPLVVMIINAENIRNLDAAGEFTDSLGEGLNTCVRGTDICGLLKEDTLIGVILTEVEPEKIEIAQLTVAKKTREKLAALLSDEMVNQIVITFRIFTASGGGGSALFDMTFYPELAAMRGRTKAGEIAKRSLDIVGSITGLIMFAPFFAVLPLLIKLSSKGPVFFLQDRIGCNGTKFKFIKFRSMYLDNDDVIHREYVKKLITGTLAADAPPGVFKIQGDPRVTPLGRYLRKYSLDELPQFINVLKGDMSLVGPRPPIRYEVENYCGWQRNRVMGKRPGITGLWQVTGRSSTCFDEMVRLDLRYLRGWSIALDLKILLRTPLAVFKCKGAY